jgi:glycosyltransferase involved in cell wall biosynthesis
MQELYQNHCGHPPQESLVAYQGIDDSIHDKAVRLRSEVTRKSNLIVSVSVMAAWKGAHTLVEASRRLHDQGIQNELRLVGPWPDKAYRTHVDQLIERTGLNKWVTITGMVPKEQLYEEMASARVFALPSCCESFGIPAVEAQAFGTPVVGSNTTAMAEIGGDGGRYCSPNDIETISALLKQMICDDEHWAEVSAAASANANRYRWSECSKPLMKMFELV